MKIIKFGAIWCPSCLIMNSRVEEIKKEIPNLNVISYDYDINKDKIEEFGVEYILPVFIFIDDNENELLRLIGEKTKNELIEKINLYNK